MNPRAQSTHAEPSPRKHSRIPAVVLLTLLLAAAAVLFLRAPEPARAQAPGRVLYAFGVGGVLTEDGTLWQYRPEKQEWLTIDEAFRQQGKQTQVLPLPVRAEEVQQMVTWGFLVTADGTCWLYDIDRNRWERLAPPAR